MTIQQCKYVIAIAKCGSMNEAARSLMVSQASLSSAVRELEDEFNIGEVPDEMVEKIRTVGQLVTYIEESGFIRVNPIGGINWVQSIKDQPEIAKMVEKPLKDGLEKIADALTIIPYNS